MDIRFFLVGEGHAVIGEFRADYPVLNYRVDYLLTRLLYRVGVGAVGVVFVAAALKEVLVLAQEVPEGDIHAFCAVGRGSRNGVRRCAGFRDGRYRLRL